VTNFSPVPHESYRIPLPTTGKWREILNTDSSQYGGSGITNPTISALNEEHKGFAQSAVIRLPPLATIWLELA
jgi:1,4-alpha-glucan branching enzyme